TAETITQIKDALRTYYAIESMKTPREEVSALVMGRPEPVRQFLVAALADCNAGSSLTPDLERQWLTGVLDASDSDPWRQRIRSAAAARDWPALERAIGEAALARQPPGFLILFAMKLPPEAAAQRLKLLREIQQTYPGDFWANHELGMTLHF